MWSPVIIFASVQVWAMWNMVRLQGRAFLTIQGIKRAYAAEGVEWDYRQDWKCALRAVLNPNAIYLPHDSPTVAAAKSRYVTIRREGRKLLRRVFLIQGLGVLMVIIGALIETLLHNWLVGKG